MQYFFVLGRNPELSILEIRSALISQNVDFVVNYESKEVFLFTTNQALNTALLNNILGGTVKIGHIVSRVEYDPQFDNLLSLITKDYLVTEFFDRVDRKIHFGISLYSLSDKSNLTSLKKRLFHFQKAIKSLLELNGINAHYPKIQAQKLSSASVKKNKLLSHGAEIILLTDNKTILVGKTDHVQEFEQFSSRDYGRPQRDVISGTMPPKLARMMINIGQSDEKTDILDPFCGSGTVLQEALLLGYKQVFGTDLSDKAVSDSKNNLEWLLGKNKEITGKYTVNQIDVTKLSKSFYKMIQTIVGEPYLGKTLKNYPTVNDAVKTIKELEVLYLQAFKEFSHVLNKGGAVVLIFPILNTKRGYKYTNIFKDIETLGFRQIELSKAHRKSIVVGDKRDFVLREIVKFVRK